MNANWSQPRAPERLPSAVDRESATVFDPRHPFGASFTREAVPATVGMRAGP